MLSVFTSSNSYLFDEIPRNLNFFLFKISAFYILLVCPIVCLSCLGGQDVPVYVPDVDVEHFCFFSHTYAAN